MSPAIAPTVKLNNGRQMPVIGLGTWMLHGQEGVELIKVAIDAGYRHFDTALLYNSEAPLGEAIRQKISEGVIKREDVFITSKLWCSYAHPELVIKACKKTLKNLGLDYVDLYLIHWPFAFKATDKADESTGGGFRDYETFLKIEEYFPRDASGRLINSDADYVDTWKQMEKCVELGLAKSIGISNFNSVQIKRLLQYATIKPVTNQVEYHPYLNQKKLQQFCEERDIILTSYRPLGNAAPPKKPGVPAMIEHPLIKKIAEEVNKTTGQVILKYMIQLGTVTIPKTKSPKRVVENISIFDFTLSDKQMTDIESLNINDRTCIIPETESNKNYPFNIEF